MKVKFKKQHTALLAMVLSASVALAFAGETGGVGAARHASGSEAEASFPAKVAEPNYPSVSGSVWSCQYGKFERDVLLNLALVTADGRSFQKAGECEVGAFIGDECRGVVTQCNAVGGVYVHKLRIWTNDSFDGLKLKLYSRSTKDTYELDLPELDFSESMVGSIDVPVKVTVPDVLLKPFTTNGVWKCYYGEYERDVKFSIALVDGNRQISSPEKYNLGLFVNGECRGFSQRPNWVGNYAVFSLRAWTNDNLDGAELKVVDVNTGDINDLVLPSFEEADMVGTIDSPILVQMYENYAKPYINNKVWKCYYSNFANCKTVYVRIADEDGGRISNLTGYQLGAFEGDDCRGIASRTGDPYGGDMFIIRIWYNEPMENLSFKFYNEKTGEIKDCDSQGINYDDDMIGSIDEPVMIKLAPKHSANAHKVTYMVDGELLTTANADFGTAIKLIAAPVKKGFTFSGWKCDYTTMPDEDIVVTGSFIRNSYKLTFVSDGEEISQSTIAYEAMFKAPEVSKVGYTFEGWVPALPEDMKMPAEDMVYTANFSGPNSFRFTFVTAEGDTIKKSSVAYGSAVVAPAAPAVKGYTFAGWNPAVPESAPARNMTFTAQYSVNKYEVKFVGNDGDLLRRDTLTFGSVVKNVPDTDVEGLTFVGWEPELFVGTTTVTDSITYTALYSKNAHKVTYLLDGNEYYLQGLEFGEDIDIIESPVKEGYTFSGWKCDYTTMPDEDIVVTGSFTKNKYNLVFKYDSENVISDLQVEYADSIKIPSVKKEGYTFIGWDSAVETVMPAHDVAYTAQFMVNSHYLNYVIIDKHDDGSSDSIAYRSMRYDYGAAVSDTLPDLQLTGYACTAWKRAEVATMPDADVFVYCERTANHRVVAFISDGKEVLKKELPYGATIELPVDPEKTGYTFTGWEPFVEATVPDYDVKYFATYTPNEYSINFVNANGSLIESHVYEYGETVQMPEVLEPVGYHFEQWSPEVAEKAEADATYTAVFAKNKYKVSFVDEEENLLVSYCMLYGSVITTSPNAPEIADKTFAGWEPEFIPGVTFVPAEEMVFKAVYKQNPFCIKYVVDGKVYYEKMLVPGEKITEIPEPAKVGHQFAGWNNLPDAMPDHDIEIAGSFIPNKHNVTFVWGEEESQKSVTEVEYGKVITAPTPSKTGYTFVGWNLIIESAMPDYDLEYTAVFAKNKYSVTFYDYDGSTVLRKQTLAYGEPIVSPSDPMRRGYTFNGWNLDVAETMPAKNLTYVATYSVNLYSFTYIVDGEVYLSKEYTYGRLLTLIPELTKKGFSFSGWEYVNPVDGESHSIPEIMPDHNVVIEGSFDQKSTFVFNDMEFSIVDFENRLAEFVGFDDASSNARARGVKAVANANELVIPAKVYDENTNDSCLVFSIAAKALENAYVTKVTIPETVERIEPSALSSKSIETISFAGDKIPVLEANAIASDVVIELPSVDEAQQETMIARAKANLDETNKAVAEIEEKAMADDHEKVNEVFTVTASSNIEGVIINGTGDYKYGNVIVLSAEPKDGYSMQWEVDGETFDGDTYVCPEARNISATLKYIGKTYNLVYKIGDEIISSESVSFNAPLNSMEAPKVEEREGYTFQGWSKLPDVMPANDVTVVGSYKINKYTVSFQIDGNTVATQEYDYGTEISMPSIEKTGYTVEWKNAQSVVPAKDVVITGHYVGTMYTITYMYDNRVLKTETVQFGSEIPAYAYAPDNTDRYTYTFAEWEYEGKPFLMVTMDIASDITLEAKVDVADGINVVIDSGNLVDVYSIAGTKVASKIPVSEIRSTLSPGVYVINGTKISVTK